MHENFIKRKSGTGYKNVKNRTNVLSGNFLKDFYCLWLYSLLIAKIETNKFLFSLADPGRRNPKEAVFCVSLLDAALGTLTPLQPTSKYSSYWINPEGSGTNKRC